MTMRIFRFVFILVFACACNGGRPKENDLGRATPPPKADADLGKQVVCPVCGLSFGMKEAKTTFIYKNVTYYFLLEDHKKTFAAEPERYVHSK